MCTMWVNNFLVLVSCLVLGHVIAAEPGSPSFDPVVVQVGSQRRSYQEPQAVTHNISIHGDNLLLDGQPYHILSGSLHYFRLPAEYWRDRLRKLRAAGLNTVSTYVEWSFHEPEYRQYSFEGDRDVAAFVRIAGEEGLRVLLRPGPYICAERDLGGFPYWLLGRYPEMRLRTRDKDFMEESKIWLAKLFEQLKPLLFGYGGPIIFVQVENEYGSFGADMDYKVQMRDIYLQHVGAAAVLYTTDGGARDYYSRGYVPGALTTIDFGPGAKVKMAFDNLRQFMPQGPLMNSEYYPGWLTHWGESLQTRSTEAVIRTMREMLQQKIHVNIYVFYGGTNFGFTSGANYNNKYEPVITSYDYDAPLSEAGDPTPKYHALRDLLKEFNYVPKDDPVPTSSPKGAYGPVTFTPRVGLLSAAGRVALGKKYSDVIGANLPSFEQLQQKSGLVLYETTLQSKGDKSLHIQRPRDWIYVYVDGKYKGSLNRMYKRFTLNVESKKNSKLSLLVEDQGRINFGNRIVDRKGILSAVIYDNKTLDGKWEITGYPLEVVDKADGQVAGKPDFGAGPVFFRGSITLPEGQKPMDTFLDTTGWGKGLVWVNGHNLGRYWPGLGPQVTLYVPGVWLNPAPASNVVEILELESAPDEYSMMFIDYPILNRTSNL